jgi:hypothetical protein
MRNIAINLAKMSVSASERFSPAGKMPVSTAGGTPTATFLDNLSHYRSFFGGASARRVCLYMGFYAFMLVILVKQLATQ